MSKSVKTKTRIFPISIKIIFVFTLFILASNFASHYVSLMWNRSAMIELSREILVNQLKSVYSNANSQYEIYEFNKELDKTVLSIEQKAQADFKKEKSILLGIKEDAKILFQASKLKKYPVFDDKNTLDTLLKLKAENQLDGFITFTFNRESYFGVYKYHPKWEVFLVRAEEFGEFYAATTEIFKRVSLVIIAMTIVCAIIGIFLMRFILRYLKIITTGIIQMTRKQKLETIDIERAPADDITFLGVAFNSLANTINNLMNIFKKFTNRDIVIKAYRDKYIKLEGTRRELTCLFSDIKSFTYMTEVLGTDIITLLNLHYTRAINAVLEEDGIIGSIIGDALLAVYGALEESQGNKSYQAIRSAYEIHRVAQAIREKMEEIKDKILSERGFLTPKEEKVYKAVLIEVGVGIDGGLVFYGNIGSYERMTNTVIGDNVNSSSRLEGLTRVYKVPVICSDYIKDDVEKQVQDHGLFFLEIDQVQVKGKTIGKKIFWPLWKRDMDERLEEEIRIFQNAREAYYKGRWKEAHAGFKSMNHPLREIFIERTGTGNPPEDWRGIWAMQTK